MRMQSNEIPIKLDRSRCACLHLRRASRAVSQFYDRYLQPAGIRGTQYAMLMHITTIKDITVGELSERLGMDQSTATRGVKVLYKMGWIAFATSRNDARKKVLVLTSQGIDKIREADPLWEQAQAKIENALKTAPFDRLLGLLDQITDIAK